VTRTTRRQRLSCSACTDKSSGVELATLSPVVKDGGPSLLAFCVDCLRELATAWQRWFNAGGNARSTQAVTQSENHANATVNADFNGCVSDPVSSGSLLVLEASDPERARVEPKYSAAFEDFWARCHGKKGNKHPAYKNFQRLKPPVEIAVQRWNLWMTTEQWKRGKSKHMEGWLNNRGWQDEPHPSEFQNPHALPEKTQQSRDTVTAWARGGK